MDNQIVFWLNDVANGEGMTVEKIKRWGEVLIMFSGDHGQGSMKIGISCLIFSRRGRLIKKAEFQVGYIDCKKDTYEVLEKTIGGSIGESLTIPCTQQLRIKFNQEVTKTVSPSEEDREGAEPQTVTEIKHIVEWTLELSLIHI